MITVRIHVLGYKKTVETEVSTVLKNSFINRLHKEVKPSDEHA